MIAAIATFHDKTSAQVILRWHLQAGNIAIPGSSKKIGLNVNMSVNTVKKYVEELTDKGLIYTENTTVISKDGKARNGSLLYTIRPIQEAVELYYERQITKLKQVAALECARQRATCAL